MGWARRWWQTSEILSGSYSPCSIPALIFVFSVIYTFDVCLNMFVSSAQFSQLANVATFVNRSSDFPGSRNKL